LRKLVKGRKKNNTLQAETGKAHSDAARTEGRKDPRYGAKKKRIESKLAERSGAQEKSKAAEKTSS